MVDEFCAEGVALMGVFHAFLVADAGEADALDDYADAFVVEVCHYDWALLVMRSGTSCVLSNVIYL